MAVVLPECLILMYCCCGSGFSPRGISFLVEVVSHPDPGAFSSGDPFSLFR